tara:strand:- start:7994 stop:8803 length:810 start_codon:yes stop_codon:yes gene_type:complete
MGNAAFYFYPQPDGSKLVTIDLGSPLGQMFSDFEWQSSTGVSISGRTRRVNGMTREIITISRDRMAGHETTATKLMALQNHLDRGYSCIFTADTDKTWLAPIRKTPVSGDTAVSVYKNPFTGIVGTQIPAVDDYVAIETMGPGMIQEIRKISSVTNLSSTAASYFECDAVNFSYHDKLAFARWYRCYYGLKRPQSDVGQAMVTNESGILFSLELRVTPDPSLLFKYHPKEGRDLDINWIPNIPFESTTYDLENVTPGEQETGPYGTGLS